MTVEVDGPFVVFLIGMRINRWWKVHKWWPVAMAMPRMLRELSAHPDIGCLGYEQSFGIIVQYWRSFEHLERYARDRDAVHWPAWVAFNHKVGVASGDVGIWHETFRVEAGQYETIYTNVPLRGLGKAGRLVSATGTRESARGRMGGA
jgi:hypothetical protein